MDMEKEAKAEAKIERARKLNEEKRLAQREEMEQLSQHLAECQQQEEARKAEAKKLTAEEENAELKMRLAAMDAELKAARASSTSLPARSLPEFRALRMQMPGSGECGPSI